jgi:hypothetical protein
MRTRALVLAIGVIACSCSGSTSELTEEDTATVRAMAFSVACYEVLCPGAPILAPDTLPEDVREAIQIGFSDEVEYVSEESLEARTGGDGRFVDGAILISPGEPYQPNGSVVAVDVGLQKGYLDYVGRAYLFERDGDRLIAVAPDSVGITVTTAVS